MSTPFHSKYFAYDLNRSGGSGFGRLDRTLFDASVDLNPHQVEAALFAMRSPLSKGALLADEVGLGKTIEAGLVLCQFWAERKRRLLVICPASLRKQWQVELEDKFNLPALAVDSAVYRKAVKAGDGSPFDSNAIIITSIHYAARMAEEVRQIPWDLVVIDEAHKLRNSYRASNKIGQALLWALEDRRKVLLTATPLQNSLSEVYGLASLIDHQIFGDLPTFRTLYANADGDLDDLRDRLSGFCTRNLRQNVQEFIRYTQRRLTTIRFTPTDDEHKLYLAVSKFMQRDDTYAFPQQQRHLTVIVVRKVLASSPVALASTLEIIRDRLVQMRDEAVDGRDITTRLLEGEDLDEELLDELLDEIEEQESAAEEQDATSDPETIDREKLEAEITEVEQYIRWARSLGYDTKTRHLLKALSLGYDKLREVGAAEKAVIFTESRRTQDYLKTFLEANGYRGQVVTYSGTNRGPDTTAIYERWLEKNRETGQISGSRPIDIRHALIDHFQHNAKILIATEAGGEGINLQFCSLLVNFDLPWNPQRIEQRVGRIHRYGQKHDVVVINFLNERNAADQRVYELLRHKFKLFEGVFGASDDVLGQLDSSAGLERRILDLYQQCRSEEEIEEGFRALQKDLDASIQVRLADTRQKLLEHFDEDVHARLRVDYEDALRALDEVGRKLWRLTQNILDGRATFDNDALTFHLNEPLGPEISTGAYTLARKADTAAQQGETSEQWNTYRIGHPLGQYCIHQGMAVLTECAEVAFDLSHYDARISGLEQFKGQAGWMVLTHLRVEGLETDDYLLFSGFTDAGTTVEHELLVQMFRLDGVVRGHASLPGPTEELLGANAGQFIDGTVRRSLEDSNRHFQERREQLYRWADDVVAAAERDLKQVKAELRAAERQAGRATTVEEQKAAQEEIRKLESRKRTARRRIFDVEDEIEGKRDQLIEALSKKMVQDTNTSRLFAVRWVLV